VYIFLIVFNVDCSAVNFLHAFCQYLLYSKPSFDVGDMFNENGSSDESLLDELDIVWD
jgi:hypothetical protein